MSEIYLHAVLGVCLLLFLSSILYLVSKRIKSIPFTVLLVITGIALSSFHFEPIETIRLSPGAVFYIYLPVLLFESAFNFNYRDFRRILVPGFLLASLGLIFSAIIVALPLWYFFDIPFAMAFMFGSVISSTDPIAVLALFKEMGVPKKLQLLVDGESFLNDATSVVMFRIMAGVTGVIPTAVSNSNMVLSGTFDFLQFLVGGVIVGAVLGIIFSYLISKIRNVGLVEITTTIIIAHIVFIAADDYLHVSGIIAVLVAGLILGNYGRSKISPKVSHNMHQMWDMLVFIVTSLVFLLIGYEIHIPDLLGNTGPILFITGALLVGRAVSVYLFGGIYNLSTKKENKIPLSWLHIANIGGLRGALPLIVILLLPDTFEHKEFFTQIVLGAIVFTLLINAMIVKPVIKFFKIDSFNKAHEVEIIITELLIVKQHLKNLEVLLHREEISEKAYKLSKKQAEKKKKELTAIIGEWITDNTKNEYYAELETSLRRFSLQTEKQTYSDLFKRGVISERVYLHLKETIVLQNECISEGQEQFSKTGIPSVPDTIKHNGSKAFEYDSRNQFRHRLGMKQYSENELRKMNFIYHKARLLGDEAVLEELEEFATDRTIPAKVINNVILFYKELIDYNRKTLADFKREYPKLAESAEKRMLKAETDGLIDRVVEELGENERISSKVLQSFKIDL